MLKTMVVTLAGLGLAACSVAGGPEIDLYHGTWGSDGIRPPPNLVQAESSDLVGRTVTTKDGLSLPIKAVLADSAGRQRYVLVPSQTSSDLIDVPVSALMIGPDRVALNGRQADLAWLQHHAPDQIDKIYPQASVAKAEPRLAGSPIPLPIANIPMVSPVPEPLVVVHDSSVVGMPVVDSDGTPVGKIDSVAAVPDSGLVLYALLTGPAFGEGSYILIPAAGMKLEGNQVRLPGSNLEALEAMRRYRHEDPVGITGAVLMN